MFIDLVTSELLGMHVDHYAIDELKIIKFIEYWSDRNDKWIL